jgi:hypothetical protein
MESGSVSEEAIDAVRCGSKAELDFAVWRCLHGTAASYRYLIDNSADPNPAPFVVPGLPFLDYLVDEYQDAFDQLGFSDEGLYFEQFESQSLLHIATLCVSAGGRLSRIWLDEKPSRFPELRFLWFVGSGVRAADADADREAEAFARDAVESGNQAEIDAAVYRCLYATVLSYRFLLSHTDNPNPVTPRLTDFRFLDELVDQYEDGYQQMGISSRYQYFQLAESQRMLEIAGLCWCAGGRLSPGEKPSSFPELRFLWFGR